MSSGSVTLPALEDGQRVWAWICLSLQTVVDTYISQEVVILFLKSFLNVCSLISKKSSKNCVLKDVAQIIEKRKKKTSKEMVKKMDL